MQGLAFSLNTSCAETHRSLKKGHGIEAWYERISQLSLANLFSKYWDRLELIFTTWRHR